jgi:phage N-6-adenine-methyltransferase
MSDLVIRDETHYLETVSQIRTLVEQIENVVDAKELADRARAAQVWAKRAKLGNEQVNLASIAKVWAERKAGQLLEVTVTHGGDRRSASRSGNTTLKTLGITKNESSEWQALAQVPDDTFQDAIDGVLQVGNVTTAAVTRMAVHYSSETDQWSTPQDLYDLLDSEFDFDIDVCATPENAKCETYFTEQDDGLAQLWTGTCWMNPPYGNEIAAWMEKAHTESRTPGTEVVCLVPARVDTAWWWNHARWGEVRFLRGRLKFGGGTMGAPFPSAVVILGKPAKVVWWERWPKA